MIEFLFMFVWAVGSVGGAPGELFCGLGIRGCENSQGQRVALADLDFEVDSFVKKATNQYLMTRFKGIHDGAIEAVIVESEMELLPSIVNLILACERTERAIHGNGIPLLDVERKSHQELCGNAFVRISTAVPWISDLTASDVSLDLPRFFKDYYKVVNGAVVFQSPNHKLVKRALWAAPLIIGISMLVPYIFGQSSSVAESERIKRSNEDQFDRDSPYSPYYSLGPQSEAYMDLKRLNEINERRRAIYRDSTGGSSDFAYFFMYKDTVQATKYVDHALKDVNVVMNGRLPPTAFMPGRLQKSFAELLKSADDKGLQLSISHFHDLYQLKTGYKLDTSNWKIKTSTYVAATVKGSAADLFDVMEFPVQTKDGTMLIPKLGGAVLRRDSSGNITVLAEEATLGCERTGTHLKCSASLTSLENGAVRGDDRMCAMGYVEGNVTAVVEHCRFASVPAFDLYQTFAFDTYFLYLARVQAVSKICPLKLPVTEYLSGLLIVKVDPGCYVKTEHFTFHSFNHLSGYLPYVMIHPVDHFTNSENSTALKVFQHETVKFDSRFRLFGLTLLEALFVNHANKWIKYWDDNTVWFSATGGVVIGILFCAFLLGSIMVYCNRATANDARHLPPPEESHEMVMPHPRREAMYKVMTRAVFRDGGVRIDMGEPENGQGEDNEVPEGKTKNCCSKLNEWCRKHKYVNSCFSSIIAICVTTACGFIVKTIFEFE